MKAEDRKKFEEIKAEVTDVYRSHRYDIEQNNFQRIGMATFANMRFLINVIEGKPTGLAKPIKGKSAKEEFEEEEAELAEA